MRLRDFAAFFPEQAVVGALCAALLLCGGAVLAWARGRSGKGVS